MMNEIVMNDTVINEIVMDESVMDETVIGRHTEEIEQLDEFMTKRNG